MAHKLRFSNLRLLATKDGDTNSPGEINYILFLDGQEITRSKWAWPISDGQSKDDLTFDFETSKTHFKLRLDVHEQDDWPEKNDFSRAEIGVDIEKDWGVSRWNIRAISANKKLDCTLSLDIAVVSPVPTPTVVTGYEHIDTRGVSTSLMTDGIRSVTVENNRVVHTYKFNFFNGQIANDAMSSIYVPSGDYRITLFEHIPQDPNFAVGGKLELPYSPFASARIINLPRHSYSNTNRNCNDSVSYIEIKHTTDQRVP
jgi:hypothetical protein